MDERTAAQVAALARAELRGDPAALLGPEVVIDSRLARPGAVFVALPGERADGHDFAADAVARGAAAVLVEHDLGLCVPQLLVPDSLAGLTALATGLVAEAIGAGLRTIALTGSSGKTSTKDLLAAVLRTKGAVIAPAGSFNNEIGVPLTATGVGRTTDFLVAEMGARGLGHIRNLCAIVPPWIGLVLNVGQAHLGEFGSVDTVAQAKGELVEALSPLGWAVLNADDPRVLAMAGRTAARIAAFSAEGRPGTGELRVWAEDVTAHPLQRYAFTLKSEAGSAPVRLLSSGAHQVGNALAAATVALAAGLEVTAVAAALSAAEPVSKWRMEVRERADGVLLINDAYNANPDSMAAALRAVAGMRRPGGRLIAVLGDMLELGPATAAQHAAVGELAGQLGVDEVIAVGEFAADLAVGARAAGARAQVVAGRREAARAAAALLSPMDVVLVKASRGLALESVAAGLMATPIGSGEAGGGRPGAQGRQGGRE